MAETINVTIEPDGAVKIGVRGVAGAGCAKLTRKLEAALGGDVTSRKRTSEFYQQDVETNRLRAGH